MESSSLSFSVFWSNKPNQNGVNPPNPQFMKKKSQDYLKISTNLPSPYLNKNFPVELIQSNREPYAVEYMFNNYGNLNSKLGTNMGIN